MGCIPRSSSLLFYRLTKSLESLEFLGLSMSWNQASLIACIFYFLISWYLELREGMFLADRSLSLLVLVTEMNMKEI